MSAIEQLLSGALSLVGNLTAVQQNGLSLHGTLDAPTLPAFLPHNDTSQEFPWGNMTAKNSNPSIPPTTGVTRTYDLTISRSVIQPDGVSKNVILVNGQFPGPSIEANWGDEIIVTVHNNITDPGEVIGIHWHGMLQKKTPWFDGVSSVQQCPIAPGLSFTYHFQADSCGTAWYHSHFSEQYTDGLVGPLIVYCPQNAPYDIDLGPVILTDHYHESYLEILKGVHSTTGDFSQIVPRSVNNLINGKGIYDCSKTTLPCTPNAGISKFRFTRGKVHHLHLINAGTEALQRFSIDGHNMTVISYDNTPIEPYTTNIVRLAIGQRVDVLVTADVGNEQDSYWMRANLSSICSSTIQPYGLAAIGYDLADLSQTPTSTAWDLPEDVTCENDDLSLEVPFFPEAPPPTSDYVQPYDISFGFSPQNQAEWNINGHSFKGDNGSPVLLRANGGNASYPPEWNVYNYGTNGSITFVINTPAGLPSHAMHMHGHHFWVLHHGLGAWDGTVTNPSNPMRRDVIQVPAGGHVVVQIVTDNPGAWPFHCHMGWHVAGGLYMTILERPDLITALEIPESLAQGCRDYASFVGGGGGGGGQTPIQISSREPETCM